MAGMRYRKLRIAWSVVCGIACVLLIALWVRSYSSLDEVYGNLTGKQKCTVDSLKGRIKVLWVHYPQHHLEFRPTWESMDILGSDASSWKESIPLGNTDFVRCQK